MKKILVIGSGGAGKSTFARKLGEMLGINVIHLDALYWQPGWIESPKADWAATVETLISGDAWIMDGNYSGTLERRLAACDTVVFLDLPPLTCLWRVLKRLAQYRNTTRPDLIWAQAVRSISIGSSCSGFGTIAAGRARKLSACSNDASVKCE